MSRKKNVAKVIDVTAGMGFLQLRLQERPLQPFHAIGALPVS